MATYRARYVFPVCGPPIADGEVCIEGAQIVAVGPAGSSRGGAKAIDLGSAAILPGLVNAHVHLELSGFPAPLGSPGIGMADWIGLVMAERRSGNMDAATSIAAGLAECQQCQVAAVGDIVQVGCALAAFSKAKVAATPFLELIAPTRQRAATAIAAAQEWAEQAAAVIAGQSDGQVIRPGLSPHAPYTVLPEVLRKAVSLSADFQMPLAMHLAESSEEIELLATGGGALRGLLDETGVWSLELLTLGRRPLDYLRVLAKAHRAAVIHGNYLDAEEIAFLAVRADTMSVVYCPRTRAFFGHRPYPLAAMLGGGVNVALGTDSRASTPDLNLLTEMRFTAARHPEVAPAAIVRMATLSAARAIGLEAWFGTLEPGKSSRLAVVPLPDHTAADPYELLLG